MTDLPIVALVGEPNAGKSTLMNKIAGRHYAVTSPVAGTTRDRQYADSEWNGREFTMVDTAGLSYGLLKNAKRAGNRGEIELEAALIEQIELAVREADVIVFVVDAKSRRNAIDRETVLKFRKAKKPVLLAINKLDSPKRAEQALADFQSLGIKEMFAVSALTGRGLGDLLDAVVQQLPPEQERPPRPENEIAVAIVGKPNVGKSSLLNAILKEKRVVVSPVPGTTRTSIDTPWSYQGTDYLFIDTAGLKRKAQRQDLPEKYSGFQTFKSIRRSDVVILVINGLEPISKQDQHIAGEIVDMGKGCIIVVNKIDQFHNSETELQQLRDHISYHFPFLWYSPLVFVSALTGENVGDVVAAIKPIAENRKKEASPEELQRVLDKLVAANPPRRIRDQREPKVLGLTQIDTDPPTFELYVNLAATISQQFRRALQKAIARDLDLWGTPVELKLRGKDRK